MKLLIHSANFGNFDKPQANVEQSLPTGVNLIETHRFSETDMPLRFNTMTPRLQARIPKMFGWQLKEADYYLWVDSSCRLPREDSAEWFMNQLGDNDIAVFRHNKRQTVQEEADFLKERIQLERDGRKQPYVLPRYENEDIDGCLKEVDPTRQLFASTAFIYKDSPKVRTALKEWWYFTSRYHSIDQLGLPEAIKDLKVAVINEDYLKCAALEYTR